MKTQIVVAALLISRVGFAGDIFSINLELCEQMKKVVVAGDSAFATMQGEIASANVSEAYGDVYRSTVSLRGAADDTCVIFRTLFSGTHFRCDGMALKYERALAEVDGCFPNAKRIDTTPSGDRKWRSSQASELTVIKVVSDTVNGKPQQITIEMASSKRREMNAAPVVASKATNTSELCTAVKKIVADQKSSPFSLAGAARPGAKSSELDTPTRIPGAKDCVARTSSGVYPRVRCVWDTDAKTLASLTTALPACLPEFTWKPGTYSGVVGTKKHDEKDWQTIELVDDKMLKRIELTFERTCRTGACFEELHPGMLDPKPKATSGGTYYDADDDDD